MLFICPTCQGNSLTSVSTPPTILVSLLATPQLQVADDGVVIVGDTVVDGGLSVVVVVVDVVGAEICNLHNFDYNNFCNQSLKVYAFIMPTFHLCPFGKKSRSSAKVVSVESDSKRCPRVSPKLPWIALSTKLP